mmetsp:Transcript_2976/g.3592  ORF Transcript_2976/g.3592 Transcript_2976/m.3592 type:complete len:101 (-) Transcript_2976:720-1022(-)
MLLKQGTHTSDAARDARSEMGVWLKSLREQQGMSQRDLANTLNLDYYTFISQLENGRGRIPPARYRDWATALQVEPTIFVKKLLSYNEPLTYEILFGDAS